MLYVGQAEALQCFGDRKFPKVLQDTTESGESKYLAITGDDNSIYAGGTYADSGASFVNFPFASPSAAIVTRIEYATATVIYNKVFYSPDTPLKEVEALSLNPDQSLLAVSITRT